MIIKINDYYEPDHYRSLCEDNFNVSRTCEYEQNTMHHIHNSCEILFAMQGTVDYYVLGNRYKLEPGDILVIGAMHHHVRIMQNLPYDRYGLTILPSYYRSFIFDINLLRVFETPTPENFENRCKHIDHAVFNQLTSLLEQLYGENSSGTAMNNALQQLLIHQIAILLYRAFRYDELDEIADPFQNERMQKIKEYINKHYAASITLDMLSELFFMHPTNISKYFSTYCGFNLHRYINTVRVCQATKLLTYTNLTMAVIAEQCGFGSISTFLKQFKEITSTSPLQYRKKYKEYLIRKQAGTMIKNTLLKP
jgi:AraC-like DNA-binding protein